MGYRGGWEGDKECDDGVERTGNERKRRTEGREGEGMKH